MVYGRDRTKLEKNGQGWITPGFSGPISYVDLPSSSHRCIDVSGNYPNANPLEITHRAWGKVGTFSRQSPTATYNFGNYPFTNQGIGASHGANPLLPSVAATITETMARTNPSRPEVSIPGLLGELREIPKQLHLAGQKHARGRSNSSAVEYNFGWDPLIQDLLKLADFTAQVDKRLQELEALHSKRGLRRSYTTFNESYQGSSNVAFVTAFSVSIGGNVKWVTDVRRWGSVQWLPQVPFTGTKGELASLARRIVHGWDFSIGGITATMWNLLPWSWFSDYFFNLGDYLDSQRNGVGAVAGIGCTMTHHRTRWSQQVTSSAPANVRPSPGHYTFEQKFRVLGTAGLSATLPFLSGKQLVTLSSIAQSIGNR